MSSSNRGRPIRSNNNLTKTQIVEKANIIAKTEGLAACSFRRLGAELGVTAMAVSYHVTTRKDLLLAMIDFAFAELNVPPVGTSPKARLKELLLRYVMLGQEHAHLVQATFQDPTLMQARLSDFTQLVRAETQALNAGDADDVLLNLLVDFAHGHIFAVAAAPTDQGSHLETFQRSLDWVLSRLDDQQVN